MPRFGCGIAALYCFAFQLSKSNKKARFSGRAFLESDGPVDSIRPRRALDLSPQWCY